ncbi:MAG: TlpA family protein disulfide reductase [Planctomycetes bacterium]|nr:TlpA family protein disulfide reductase [Planctomycetota bacterium]
METGKTDSWRMRNEVWLVPLFFFALLGLLAGVGVFVAKSLLRPSPQPPPTLRFTGLNGEEIDLARYRGKVVLVDFWATWCMPCVQEMPNVLRLYDRYHDEGFEVIGISLDAERSDLEAFIRNHRVPWPQYFDGKGWENDLAVQFGVQAIPFTMLLDRNGGVRSQDLRGKELAEAVAALIRESEGKGAQEKGGSSAATRPETMESDSQDAAPSSSPAPTLVPGADETGENTLVVPLEYSDKGYPLGVAASWREGTLMQQAAENPGKNAPPVKGGRRLWGELVLGPRESPSRFLFILDDQMPKGYTFYVDADADGDLADDSRPLRPEGSGGAGRTLRLTIRYPGPEGDIAEPYALWLFTNEDLWRNQHVGYYASCHRAAEIRLDDLPYRIALFDNPADGDYSNDPLLLDLNRDGKAQENEQFHVGETARLDGLDLNVQNIAPSGKDVRLGVHLGDSLER